MARVCLERGSRGRNNSSDPPRCPLYRFTLHCRDPHDSLFVGGIDRISSSTFLAIWHVIDRVGGLLTPAPVSDCPSVTVIDKCGQATKGVWWMPWHREATKDVVACDMLREAGKRASIRRFLNVETRLGNPQSSSAEFIGVWKRTQGTETSKYLEEKKEKSIPSVAASEGGTAQTLGIFPEGL